MRARVVEKFDFTWDHEGNSNKANDKEEGREERMKEELK